MWLNLTTKKTLVNFTSVAGVCCGWKPDGGGWVYREVALRGVNCLEFGVGLGFNPTTYLWQDSGQSCMYTKNGQQDGHDSEPLFRAPWKWRDWRTQRLSDLPHIQPGPWAPAWPDSPPLRWAEDLTQWGHRPTKRALSSEEGHPQGQTLPDLLTPREREGDES